MTKATESALSELHGELARALTEIVKGGERDEVIEGTDEDGNPTRTVVKVKTRPTAAELQAAAKFLKDNAITVDPAESAELGALDEALKARRSKRRLAPTPDELNAAAGLLRGS